MKEALTWVQRVIARMTKTISRPLTRAGHEKRSILPNRLGNRQPKPAFFAAAPRPEIHGPGSKKTYCLNWIALLFTTKARFFRASSQNNIHQARRVP